jgi:hypothetical protein
MLTELVVIATLPVFLIAAESVWVDWSATVEKERDVGIICHDADVACPVPWIATVRGDVGASLVIVRVALTVLALEAVKVTVKVLFAPAAS